MKKILIILSIMFCSVAFAHTIEWYVGDTLLSTTTCESGDNITPPTAPAKFGYSFREWLPYKERIEYLESTGTQWIDTGIAYNTELSLYSFKIDFDFAFISNFDTQYTTFAGINDGGQRQILVFARDRSNKFIIMSRTSCCSTLIEKPLTTVFGERSHIVLIMDAPNRTYSVYGDIDSVNGTLSTIATADKNIYLFQTNGFWHTDVFVPVRIYRFTIESNGVKIRDFIPVLDENGTPCMYDKVEKKFYYNAGTGQFIAGPIINE